MIGQIAVDVEYGSQKKEVSSLIVAEEQRLPPLEHTDYTMSKGIISRYCQKIPTVFQKNVRTIKGYKPMFD